MLCDIERPLVEEAAREIQAEGGRALALDNDISKPEETERLVEQRAGAFRAGGYSGEQRGNLPAYFD